MFLGGNIFISTSLWDFGDFFGIEIQGTVLQEGGNYNERRAEVL